MLRTTVLAHLVIALSACRAPQGPSPTLGSDLPSSEPGGQTGCAFLPPEEYSRLPEYTADSPWPLPKEVDLSDDLPPVGDQGAQGSCVGWSTAYAVRSYLARQADGRELGTPTGGMDPTSVFSPAFVYHLINGGRDGGASIRDAMHLMTDMGAATWDLMPYSEDDATSAPNPEALCSAEANRIGGWGRVKTSEVDRIKAVLATRHPIVIGISVDDAFRHLSDDEVWRSRQGRRSGDHALTVVGYSDDRRAFRVLNSWGAAWADGGYGWIGYDHLAKETREAYVAVLNPGVDGAPGPVSQPRAAVPKETAPQHEDEDPTAAADPAARIVIHPASSRPRDTYREREDLGRWVRVQGELEVPPGTGRLARVELVHRVITSDGSLGAPISVSVPSPLGGPPHGVAGPFELGGTSGFALPWRAYSSHEALGIGRGAVVEVQVTAVLVVDGSRIARSDPIRIKVTG